MKKRNKKIINNKIRDLLLNQKGMALLTTLIFIFILVTFGVALLSMTSNDMKLSALQRDSTKAFYIAEAGIERTLFNLKKDYEDNQNWNDGTINGIYLEDGELYADETFGEGTYTVTLDIKSSNSVTIKSKGKYIKTTRYIQIDAKVGPLSIWDNAIFAGAGASGRVINGNVDIRGSVHLLGKEGGEAMNIGMEVGGTGGIGNNYDGMDSDLRNRATPIPIIEGVETLSAKLRVMRGDVNLSGTATVGDPDISGNSYKETLDGVYINGVFGGNKGVDNVYSDDGIDPYKPYDFEEGTFEFPKLDDVYISPDTDESYSTYDGYLVAEAHNITTLKDSAGGPLGLDISLIDSTTDSFTGYSTNFYGEFIEIIDWNKDEGTLSISGVIVIDGDFSIGDKHSSIEYEKKGTIVSTGDIFIYGNILAKGVAKFPEENALGLVAYNDIILSTTSQLKIMGAIYAEEQITSAKQNQIVGTFVSDFFDMGGQVPSIYQVPGLENHLPPGMPGAVATYRIYTSNWHEVHK